MCDFIARVFLRCCVCCWPWFGRLPNQGAEYHAVATKSMENKKLTGSGSIEATHKCSACLCETIQGSTIANQPFVLAASLCTAPGNGRHCWERKFPGNASPDVCVTNFTNNTHEIISLLSTSLQVLLPLHLCVTIHCTTCLQKTCCRKRQIILSSQL